MARKKKISMQDIADKLNISKNAVSLALMNKKGISEATRYKVLQTAKELGYGQFAAKEAGNMNILILFPERIMSYQDNDHFQFFHDMIWGLERSIRGRGYNAVVAPIDREMESGLKLPGLVSELPCRGIILFGIVDKEYARLVWDMELPLVMLDSYYRDLPCPVVTSANIEGAYEATSVLIAAGHREIGFIGPTNLTTSHEERWFGFWKAMREQSVHIYDKYCLTESNGYDETEREIALWLNELDQLPSGFFCGNDRIAYILVGLLKERGITVPQQVSVVGYDDLQYSAMPELRMTTVHVEKEKMCHAAADLLLSLSGRNRDMIRVFVPPTLVIRDSVRKLG
ncbi:LacI family DNA-binding transcriptional regulator [Paenibacillus aceti]|uniref:LacI family transcriptional regulator n=1 Tax=Paenibacillus aceti TaxID=1820010 RepID=A0ABQ1W5P7_9BACL|nr:LacI family DNA-binding transcriptional regulator [Paenibacillus aceti]GGG16315.1 LacI family transcriptional regulator [Paenibacillus aceti]